MFLDCPIKPELKLILPVLQGGDSLTLGYALAFQLTINHCLRGAV